MGNSATDRLGDAIREIARGMAEHGKSCIRLSVVCGDTTALYEVRLIRTKKKKSAPSARRGLRRVGGVLVIDPKNRR